MIKCSFLNLKKKQNSESMSHTTFKKLVLDNDVSYLL